MDLIDKIKALSSKIEKQQGLIQTEEATKSAFVMPFISALGYDVFDPTEVVPEFTADVGIKKGEKVDYAIMRDKKAIILFECKKCGTDLNKESASQLYRYFSVTEARFGILTDGVIYRFYSDIEEPNKMDKKPFMELNLFNLDAHLITELKKLTKSSFDLEEMLGAANELKYSREIKKYLGEQLNSPDEEFVKLVTSKVYGGRITQYVKDQFTEITKKAFTQFINELINNRLKSAIADDTSFSPDNTVKLAGEEAKTASDGQEENGNDSKIETTVEEMEGFYIVKSILRQVVDPTRILHRDTQSYFGILLDDNNRKPICRLHFNRTQWYIGIFGDDKKETRVPINDLNEIYNFADQLKVTVASYND